MKLTHDLHFVRKHILKSLTLLRHARFRDLRPMQVDSNLYSYHLKRLVKEGYVVHEDGHYGLSPLGLRYADHLSLKSAEPRWQPKVITKLVITNEHGQVLVWPKYRQPFLGLLSLPTGKVHFEDASLEQATRRELRYITHREDYQVWHRGLVELQASIDGIVVSHVISHVFSLELKATDVFHEFAQWKDFANMTQSVCSPGTVETLQCIKQGEGFFYKLVIDER